jgi:hypothetical protein
MAALSPPRLQVVGALDAVSAATSTALLPRPGAPLVCYDVNGYYAELGVHWRATRRELADAYRERGGPDDARLTYVFQRLLNREFRARYDARQPGQRMVDEDSKQLLRQRAHLRAAAINTERGENLISGHDIFLSVLTALKNTHPESFDPEDDPGLECSTATEDRQPPSQPPMLNWPYAYLLLGSTCSDIRRLAQWQEGIVRALANHETVQRIAVGFHGKPGTPFLVKALGDAHVFLLHEDQECTPGVIAAAATAAHRH